RELDELEGELVVLLRGAREAGGGVAELRRVEIVARSDAERDQRRAIAARHDLDLADLAREATTAERLAIEAGLARDLAIAGHRHADARGGGRGLARRLEPALARVVERGRGIEGRLCGRVESWMSHVGNLRARRAASEVPRRRGPREALLA